MTFVIDVIAFDLSTTTLFDGRYNVRMVDSYVFDGRYNVWVVDSKDYFLLFSQPARWGQLAGTHPVGTMVWDTFESGCDRDAVGMQLECDWDAVGMWLGCHHCLYILIFSYALCFGVCCGPYNLTSIFELRARRYTCRYSKLEATLAGGKIWAHERPQPLCPMNDRWNVTCVNIA